MQPLAWLAPKFQARTPESSNPHPKANFDISLALRVIVKSYRYNLLFFIPQTERLETRSNKLYQRVIAYGPALRLRTCVYTVRS